MMTDARRPARSWRDLRPDDIETLISLHAESLPGSSLSMAGRRTLGSFYRFAATSGRETVLLCRSVAGGILGAAVVSADPASIKRRMLRSGLPFSAMLDKFLPRPAMKAVEVTAPATDILVEVLGQLASGPASRPHAPEVLHIFAHGSVRGAGIGRVLMNACEREAISAGYRDLFVHTRAETGNPALRFYGALGYSEVETHSEGGKRLTLFRRSLAAAPTHATGR